MNKKRIRLSNCFILMLIMVFNMGITAYAEDDTEPIDVELSSFAEMDGQWEETEEPDQYVDGIYNVGVNARASMAGVIRLYQSDTKIVCSYTTTYTHSVNRIGTKNIKLQYKGSLGLWHNIVTLDDRYNLNDSSHIGAFSCNGVVGRVYRAKGTHYIVEGSYKEDRDNVTLGLTFK